MFLLMLEDVYASSDVNIVMMMFFELFYPEKFLSSQAGLEPTTRSPAIRRLWVRVPLGTFLSKIAHNNIVCFVRRLNGIII